MGICYWDAKVMWEARTRGATFTNTLTIGRQALNLHPREVAEFQRGHAQRNPGASGTSGASRILNDYSFYDYAEPFVREALGADKVTVLDYSDYEGADVLHDLNQPVPDAWHDRYDAIIDGGTLEHVFNFPVAVANLMNMTKPGGRVFLFLPANNLCGHGFYQFSPELMFRVFSPQNGFETERIVLWGAGNPGVELTPGGLAYEVTDPEKVQGRVGLMTRGAVTMVVQARKTATVPLFQSPPFQSDYSAAWKASHAEAVPRASAPGRSIARSLLRPIWRNLPSSLRAKIQGFRQRREYSFANKSFFKPLFPGGPD
jgi:SAM-dependent methyltransferase